MTRIAARAAPGAGACRGAAAGGLAPGRHGPLSGRTRSGSAVERLNLDAASFRQLHEANDGDPDKIRAAVLDIVRTRGKMQNPVTGSGGMLTGVVDEAGPDSPLGLARATRSPPWSRSA